MIDIFSIGYFVQSLLSGREMGLQIGEIRTFSLTSDFATDGRIIMTFIISGSIHDLATIAV